MNNNKNRISQEKRQALEMIEQSHFMKTINAVTVQHGKFLNTLNNGDISESEKIIDRMVEIILSDSNN